MDEDGFDNKNPGLDEKIDNNNNDEDVNRTQPFKPGAASTPYQPSTSSTPYRGGEYARPL